jgi:hypothetical protein
MLQLNSERFASVVTEATERAKVAPKDSKRWQNAINKARAFMETSAMWHLCDDDTLILVSDSSFEMYEVDARTCERIDGEKRVYCPAFQRGEPCYHRAARRLVMLYAHE